MEKQIFFFLTKNDYVCIVQEIEKNISLKYVEAKAYTSKDYKQYNTLLEYENLGINKSGDTKEQRFLVVEENEEIVLREVLQKDGTYKYFIDQMQNENSVIFQPGGMYNERYFIAGNVGTIAVSEKSKRILNTFSKVIKKKCKTKIGRYYISEEAESIYQDVRFITMNVKQSEEYDLKVK